MTEIVLRSLTGGTGSSTKNSALTITEVDTNFNNLNNFKLEITTTTGSAVVPAGTTVQRDASPAAGYLRFNTTTGLFEGYGGASWTNVGSVTLTDDTTQNTTYYPTFATATSGQATAVRVSSTKLTYNPSTGTLTSTIMSATDFNSTSDANLKDNIVTLGGASATLAQIRGVSFNWKENGKKSYGVIAQELQQVLPDLVTEVDGKLSVAHTPLIAFLIEAMKEQDQRIKALEQQLAK